jgi:hypothetical protein
LLIRGYPLAPLRRDLSPSDDKPLPPDIPQPNWLPVPRNAPFSLTLRMYWPRESVLDGEFEIPAVRVAS